MTTPAWEKACGMLKIPEPTKLRKMCIIVASGEAFSPRRLPVFIIIMRKRKRKRNRKRKQTRKQTQKRN